MTRTLLQCIDLQDGVGAHRVKNAVAHGDLANVGVNLVVPGIFDGAGVLLELRSLFDQSEMLAVFTFSSPYPAEFFQFTLKIGPKRDFTW